MTYRIRHTRWKFCLGIEDHETGLLSGLYGDAPDQEECEALVEYLVDREQSKGRSVLSVELGELCGECEGEGLVAAGNEGRVLCVNCGGHLGALASVAW
jgi:hypothetical protein